MREKGISQEWLKIIACVTMLADHIGAIFFPGSMLRLIGRIAFPVYCFLLAEGVFHTRNMKRYGIRLLIGILLAEIPYDFLFYGGWNWGKQNVMVTLLLGFLYCAAILHIPNLGHRILMLLPFAFLGELMHADYGGWGVVMIGMFYLTKDQPWGRIQQVFWLLVISWMISKATIAVGSLRLPLQPFAVLAMIPISLYDGHKLTNNVWIQRIFYLFYPVHLVVLYLLKMIY